MQTRHAYGNRVDESSLDCLESNICTLFSEPTIHNYSSQGIFVVVSPQLPKKKNRRIEASHKLVRRNHQLRQMVLT